MHGIRDVVQSVERDVLKNVFGRVSGERTYTVPLAGGASTYINVGNVNNDTSIFIDYYVVRGALEQQGTITILSAFTDEVKSPPAHTYVFDDIGLTVTADYSGANIRLICTLDAGVDATFKYSLDVLRGTKESLSDLWNAMISATVEDAAPADVILTFPSAIPLIATDITATVNGVARVVSSASWTGAVWTVVLASAVIYGDIVVMTFGKTGQTSAVTNNVIYSMLLTSIGDGTGVSTLKMTVSDDIILTLGANAKFYSDAGGTADESATWALTAGALRTIYLKCTTGTATMKFSDVTKVTSWGEWISSTNAASISGDISRFISLTYLNAWGSNTISGNITGLTSLTYLLIGSSNTITGSIAGLTSLTYLNIRGSSAVSGSIAGLTLLTYLYITGSSTVSGSIATNVLDELTDCYLLPCGMVDYTAGQIWPDIRVTINPFAGYGYDSTEIDNILIDMAASNSMSGKTITLTGSSAARTAASDAAVLKLETADSGYVHLVNTIKTN